MAQDLPLAEILLNKQNIALARSQKLIQSWLPPVDPSASTTAVADDEDFQPESELAGVGSKRKADDEEGVLGGLKKRKVGSSDKLLEQLLGKKGAQAKRKEQEAQRASAKSMHAASKQMAVKPKVQISAESDEEEEGRAGAFKSRKRKPAREQKMLAEDAADGFVAGSDDENADERAAVEQPTPVVDSPPPIKKAKPTSYLDELLSQKAGKKKKKKKQKSAAQEP